MVGESNDLICKDDAKEVVLQNMHCTTAVTTVYVDGLNFNEIE